VPRAAGAAPALWAAACTCESKNADIEGQLLVTSPGQADLQPLKAVVPSIGGAAIVDCLRGDSCPELNITVSNLYQGDQDCFRESGLPFCFDLGLRLAPGREGPVHDQRVCAAEAERALTIDYRQFPGKNAPASETGVAWQSGCVEFHYSGQTLDVRFQDVRLQLDSGRGIELRGQLRLSNPGDRASC
jgi:hypothetical protein